MYIVALIFSLSTLKFVYLLEENTLLGSHMTCIWHADWNLLKGAKRLVTGLTTGFQAGPP